MQLSSSWPLGIPPRKCSWTAKIDLICCTYYIMTFYYWNFLWGLGTTTPEYTGHSNGRSGAVLPQTRHSRTTPKCPVTLYLGRLRPGAPPHSGARPKQRPPATRSGTNIPRNNRDRHEPALCRETTRRLPPHGPASWVENSPFLHSKAR